MTNEISDDYCRHGAKRSSPFLSCTIPRRLRIWNPFARITNEIHPKPEFIQSPPQLTYINIINGGQLCLPVQVPPLGFKLAATFFFTQASSARPGCGAGGPAPFRWIHGLANQGMKFIEAVLFVLILMTGCFRLQNQMAFFVYPSVRCLIDPVFHLRRQLPASPQIKPQADFAACLIDFLPSGPAGTDVFPVQPARGNDNFSVFLFIHEGSTPADFQ